MMSNILGTFNLLEGARKHFEKLPFERKKHFLDFTILVPMRFLERWLTIINSMNIQDILLEVLIQPVKLPVIT